MGHVTHVYRGRHTRINSIHLGVVLLVLSDIVHKCSNPEIREAVQIWRTSTIHLLPFVLELDELLLEPDNASAFVELIDVALKHLDTFGGEVTADYINSGLGTSHLLPQPTAVTSQTLHALRNLVIG